MQYFDGPAADTLSAAQLLEAPAGCHGEGRKT